MSAFFGVQRPPDMVVTVSASGPGNTGQAIVSSIANVSDGRPDSTARLQWQTGGSQTTSSILNINLNWTATPFSPRLIGISNISLPDGTKVSAAFRRSGDTIGTYPYLPTMYNNAQRIYTGPRGEKSVFIMLPAGATADVLGAQIQIANDVNGSVGNSAGLGTFNVGDIVVCPGYDWDVEAGWQQPDIDPTMRDFTWNKQPYADVGCVYRQLDFAFKTDEQKTYFRDSASPSTMYLRKLLACLDRGQTAFYAMRYVDAAGTFNATQLHETGFLGMAVQLPKISAKAGPLYTASGATVIEAPIPT